MKGFKFLIYYKEFLFQLLKKKITFAVKWIIKLLKDNDRIVKISTVVDLLISTIYNRGSALKKKQEVYKVLHFDVVVIKNFLLNNSFYLMHILWIMI